MVFFPSLLALIVAVKTMSKKKYWFEHDLTDSVAEKVMQTGNSEIL